MHFLHDDILLVHKPVGWTSFDVVKKIKGMFHIKKIGHAGTLDPLAEGLLILAVGKKTKELQHISQLDKEYVATFVLGATTPTLDRETAPSHITDTSNITLEQLQSTLRKHFTGEIQQTPPQFSAVKKNGKTAYKEARKGNEIQLDSKTITLHSIDIIDTKIISSNDLPGIEKNSLPEVQLFTFTARISCSKGTYIRSLADDIAKTLSTRGYLLSLTRTRIGNYKLEQAETLEMLIKQKDLLGL